MLTRDEAILGVRHAATRFFRAKRDGLPLVVVKKRYRAVYLAMDWARRAGVAAGPINRIIVAAEKANG